MREVLATYDPAFDAGSLDEAHLDVTQYCRDHELSGAQVCQHSRYAQVQLRFFSADTLFYLIKEPCSHMTIRVILL